MLRMEKVPAATAGAQLIWLLHTSEILFPPMNAVGMFSNLIVGVTGYIYRDSNAAAKAKYPYALTGFVLNVMVTGYALGIMAPINRKIKAAAHALQSEPSNEAQGKELRKWQATWQTWNYGELSPSQECRILLMKSRPCSSHACCCYCWYSRFDRGWICP